MAIMNNIEMNDYKEIQVLIEEILLKRKYKFNIDDMIIEIRKEAINRGFDIKFVDCSFFDILVLNTIDRFVDDKEDAKFYRIGKVCFPVDYIIYENYQVNSETRLLYYVLNNNSANYLENNSYFIDIETGEVIKKANKMDFVLCGGVSKDKYKTTLQSNIDYKEILLLFNAFLKEGASRVEAINHILNYYKAVSIPNDHSWGKDFIINKKENKIKKESEKEKITVKTKKRIKKLFDRR